MLLTLSGKSLAPNWNGALSLIGTNFNIALRSVYRINCYCQDWRFDSQETTSTYRTKDTEPVWWAIHCRLDQWQSNHYKSGSL